MPKKPLYRDRDNVKTDPEIQEYLGLSIQEKIDFIHSLAKHKDHHETDSLFVRLIKTHYQTPSSLVSSAMSWAGYLTEHDVRNTLIKCATADNQVDSLIAHLDSMNENQRIAVLDKVDSYEGVAFFIKRTASRHFGGKEFKQLVDKAYKIDLVDPPILLKEERTHFVYCESLLERIHGSVVLKDGTNRSYSDQILKKLNETRAGKSVSYSIMTADEINEAFKNVVPLDKSQILSM